MQTDPVSLVHDGKDTVAAANSTVPSGEVNGKAHQARQTIVGSDVVWQRLEMRVCGASTR